MIRKHRGISYSVVRTAADMWEWSVNLGHPPPMLRIGEASSEYKGAMQARQLIDTAFDLQKPTPVSKDRK